MAEKRTCRWLIAGGILLSAALAVGTALRLAPPTQAEEPPAPIRETQEAKEPLVRIQDPAVKADSKTQDKEDDDPGKEAVSSGTEQTIQREPTKPNAPEGPNASGQVQEDHTAEDVPETERNAPAPPAQGTEQTREGPTEPAAGSTNDAGQVYIPGFGYVDYEGDNVGIKDDSMYENGNKIGIIGGG